jgi:UDP:flavonoid glycosyltransferase YjiC (YdhE family)
MKCLFMINGLGLGNSTRCHAVIERLAQKGAEVHVLTSGNGLTYFEGKPCIASLSPMASLYYSLSGAGVSGWSTLKSLGSLARRAKAKRRQLEALLDQLSPEIAIIDSEYALSPLRRRGIPVIGLNTSEIVVSEYLRHRRQARGTRSHFWFVEFSDYLFHRHYCDLVLSPFPLRTPTRHPKFQRIGLVVRRAVTDLARQPPSKEAPVERELKKVVFMLSGSVHASSVPFERYQLPFQIDVVGRSGQSGPNLTFYGHRMDNVPLLAAADVLVINGGYSALSEAFTLRKHTFVIPIPGHAEQFVNGCLVRDLGLGRVATEGDVLEQLLDMHRQGSWIGLKPMSAVFETNGASEAAEAIESFYARQTSAKVKISSVDSRGRMSETRSPAPPSDRAYVRLPGRPMRFLFRQTAPPRDHSH